jgi:hypothetical protein
MQPDSITRALLALILVCLVILIVQGASDGGIQPGWGRYSVTGMRAGAPVLIRTDTVSGQVWKLELRGGGNKWVPFTEPDAAPVKSAESQPAPTPNETAVVEREIIEPPAPPPPAAPARKRPQLMTDELDGYMEALERPDLPPEIHAWVLTKLAPSDDPRAVQALLDALAASDSVVIMTAVEALWQRDDPRVRPALEALLDHPDAAVSTLVRERFNSLD